MIGEGDVTIDLRPGTDAAMRLAHAQHLLDSMQQQIRSADEKIRVLFGATALLAAALAFDGQHTLTQLRADGLTGLELTTLGARVLLLVAVAVAVAAGIVALLPRVRAQQVERSLVFFGHIATAAHDGFVAEVRALPADALERQLLSQVHVTARIVAIKYAWTRRAATAFMVAVGLLIVIQSLALFA